MQNILANLHDDQQKEETHAEHKGKQASAQTAKNNFAESIMKSNGNKGRNLKHAGYNPHLGSSLPFSPLATNSKEFPLTVNDDENTNPNRGGGGSSGKKR